VTKLAKFKTQAKNANKHTARGLGMLAETIGKDGWIGAITVASDGETFDGSARLEVLADAMPGAEPIIVETDGHRPVIIRRTDIASADDPRAIRLGLGANRIHEVDYDPDGAVLAELGKVVDLSQFWTKDELADLIPAETNDAADPGADVDRAAELQEKWQTAVGQLWQIGRHRLLVGDCTVRENVERLMGGERAGAVVTDPPYNIGLAYDGYDDNLPPAQYLSMVNAAMTQMLGIVEKDAHLTCTLGHNQIFPVRDEIISAGWKFRHIGVWHNPQRKAGSHPGMWPFAWEALLDFTNGGFRKLNNGNSVGYSDVWIEAPGAETDHPAERPIVMWQDVVGLVSNAGDVVVDPFNGSGTTLAVCEKLGRIGRGIELSPAYAAVTLERLTLMGLDAHLMD
jgi:DNA modification methylase